MNNLTLDLGSSAEPSVLCLGAHCDDIEIGCAATISQISKNIPNVRIDWVVFSANGDRREEAANAAEHIAGGAETLNLHFFEFRDGYLPYEGSTPKDRLKELAKGWNPDVIFTHYGNDAHQDHRLISEITYNLFRDHLILEYEIPKYDGDLGQPNLFVPITKEAGDKKINALLHNFKSQANKHWFTDETFRSLLRLRGIESGRQHVYAEAFYCRKMGIRF